MSELQGLYQIKISGMFLTERDGLAVVTRDITDTPVKWTIAPPVVSTANPATSVTISLKIDFPKGAGIGPVEFPQYLTLGDGNTISVVETRTPPTENQMWTLPQAHFEPSPDPAHPYPYRRIQSVAKPELEASVLGVLLPAGTDTLNVTAEPRRTSAELELQKWTFEPIDS